MMRSLVRLLMAAGLSLVALSTLAETQWLEAELAGEAFRLERVADPESRRQGLMGRTHLAENEGMLFDFPAGTVPAIWMHNMVISLDLLYLDGDGRIAYIFADVPPCASLPCDVYQASEPLRFVLELAAGSAERLKLQRGQRLDLGAALEQPVPDY